MLPFCTSPRRRGASRGLPRAGLLALVAAAALAAGPVLAQGAGRIGTIKIVKGETRIIEGAGVEKAAVGGAVHQNDVLETGPDGALGLTFVDDTTLSLGPNSRITLTKIVFDPDKGNFAFLANIV